MPSSVAVVTTTSGRRTRRRARRRTAVAIPLRPPRLRRQNARPGIRSRGGGLAARYLASLQNPFHVTPPKLGWGILGDSSLASGWIRANTSPSNNVVIAMACGTWTSLGTASTNPLTIFANGNNALALADATSSINAYPYANIASLQALGAAGRTVTAGLRTTLPMPTTSAIGRIYAGTVSCTMVALRALTFTQLSNLASMQPVAQDCDSGHLVEVTYRPLDAFDLDLTAAYGNSTGTGTTQTFLLVYYTFGANGSSVNADCVGHFETQGGLLTSADDVDDPSLSETMSLDAMRPLMRRLPQVKSGTMVRLEDSSAFEGLSRHRSGGRRAPLVIQEAAAASSGAGPPVSTRSYYEMAANAAQQIANMDIDYVRVASSLAGAAGLEAVRQGRLMP